jgi:hypothetical protein
MSHKGNSLTIPEKEMVVHVKHYFDKEQELYSKTKEFPSVINPARRTALATNLSEVTVWRIMAEYNRNNTLSRLLNLHQQVMLDSCDKIP